MNSNREEYLQQCLSKAMLVIEDYKLLVDMYDKYIEALKNGTVVDA